MAKMKTAVRSTGSPIMDAPPSQEHEQRGNVGSVRGDEVHADVLKGKDTPIAVMRTGVRRVAKRLIDRSTDAQ